MYHIHVRTSRERSTQDGLFLYPALLRMRRISRSSPNSLFVSSGGDTSPPQRCSNHASNNNARLLLLRLDNVVNDGVEEHAADSDAAAQELHEVELLAKDEGHAHDNDHALGRVGHGLGDGVLQANEGKL